MSRYPSACERVYDSIKTREQRHITRAANESMQEREATHFKNVVISRFGNDPSCMSVISKWCKTKSPAYAQIQLLSAKSWDLQQRTDLEILYDAFIHLSNYIKEVEKKYKGNPEVRILIEKTRSSSDVRIITFEKELMKIVG